MTNKQKTKQYGMPIVSVPRNSKPRRYCTHCGEIIFDDPEVILMYDGPVYAHHGCVVRYAHD